MRTENEYNKMNWLYNALYGDISTEELRKLEFVNIHSELLNGYQKESLSIIDSACGNGIQATALALNGYHVTATDNSGEMIKLASDFAMKHHVSMEMARKSWTDLPLTYASQFDIVFCTGNSIVHSRDSYERNCNLKALQEILKNHGTLVIETRNWEKILAENYKFTAYNKLTYQNKAYIPLYHWILNGMENEAKVEILFQEIREDNTVQLYQSDLSFTPFTHESLVEALRSMNLSITKDTYAMENDWYMVYAQKMES